MNGVLLERVVTAVRLKTLIMGTSIVWAFLLFQEPAFGVFYYVAVTGNDSNPGTLAQPWRTIQKAADTLVAGDTVYVRSGTYTERVTPQNSGVAGSYITYSAYPGDQVTIDGSSVTLPDDLAGLFEVSCKSYIVIAGLRAINAGPYPDNAAILIKVSSHVIVRGNSTYNSAASGIGVWGSDHVTVEGNTVEAACNSRMQECISVAGTDTFEVRDNTVSNCYKEGICLKDGSSNGRVYRNHVDHTQDVGIYVDAWDKHTFNIDVFQNTVHDAVEDNGFCVASERGGLLENIRIYNNIAYHNRYCGLGVTVNGIGGPINNIQIINNTFYNNGWTVWGGGIVVEGANARNVFIRNNIVSQNLYFQIALDPLVSAQDVTIDHNLIDGFRGTEGEVYGSDYVEGDPRFVDSASADFRLQATSPAIDQSSATLAPTEDFVGTQRPQGAGHDIGAFEYRSDGSTSLYFPHIASNSLWESEIGIINPSATQTATGTLRPFGDSGNEVSNAVPIVLGPHSRREITVGQEFLCPEAIGSLRLESDSSSLKGYTKFYRQGLYRAAIPAASKVTTGDLFFAHVTSDPMWWTGVSVLNTTSAAKTVNFEFNDGTTIQRSIAANEHQKFLVSDLFNGQTPAGISSGVVTNAGGVIGLELFSSANQVEGIPLTDETATTLYYPYVPEGTRGWWVGVVVYNPSDTACSLTITPYLAGGSEGTAVSRALNGKEKLVALASALGVPLDTAWFKIEATSPITGFELIGTADSNQVGGFYGLEAKKKEGVCAKIERNGGWTYLVLANTEDAQATVTLTAYDDSGSPVATTTFALDGHAEAEQTAEQFFAGQNITTATYLTFSSTKDLVALQLNGSADSTMLDGLAGL